MTLEQLQYPIGKCNYPDIYTEEILRQYIFAIQTFPRRLELQVQQLLEFQLQTPYRENGWTVNQVIHHCAESHMNALIRLKLTLSEDNPTIKPYVEYLWAEMADYQLPFNNSITLLFCIHEKIVTILKALKASDWERTFFHPEYQKTFTLKALICLYAWHGDHHLAHITGLKQRMGWE